MVAENRLEESFFVGDWYVLPREGVIKAASGSARLEPKVMEVLVYLASRSGDVVSRDELERNVWRGALVGYDAVTSTVIKLRKALGDSSRDPNYIATIPKKGYQLIAPVRLPVDEPQTERPTDEPAATGASKNPHLLKIALLIGGLAAIALAWSMFTVFRPASSHKQQHPEIASVRSPSVVVIPFTNLSGDADQEYFADGMTEDLITDLSKISALSVIARSSAFTYKGTTPNIPVIAKALGVTHIVVGSIRQSGNRVRITVNLIDASTGKHLWAERYDRKLRDIFALEDEVRGKIIKALSVKLTALEQQRAALKATTNVEAYDLLMKGRYQEGSFSRQGNERAIGFYRRAVAIDPGFAEAYARMANMYDLRSRFGWSDDNVRDRKMALQFARKAIDLDANDPYSYWTLGRILSRDQDGGGALSESVNALERAINLNPNYADAYAYLSLIYLGIGKPDEALSAIQTAMRLNPRYPFWYIRNRGLISYMEGKYSPAIADLEEAAEQNPTTFIGRWWLAAAYAQVGRQEDAAWQMEEIRVLREEFTIQKILDLSIIHYPPYVERLTAGLRKAGARD